MSGLYRMGRLPEMRHASLAAKQRMPDPRLANPDRKFIADRIDERRAKRSQGEPR